MKKYLNIGFIFIGLAVSAQTYCVPEFESTCEYGDQIDSFEIPSANFSHLDTGCSPDSYGDFTAQTINLSAGVSYPFSITHGYSDQNIRMWLDINNDGTFDDLAPELIAFGSSTDVNGVNTTNGIITIPVTVAPGLYRLRVGDRFSSDPIPCNLDGYGEAQDYTVNVGAVPSCLAPAGLTVTGITSNAAALSWTAPGSSVGVGYEYYVSTSNAAPGVGAAVTGSVSNSSLTAPLINLLSNTEYHVWVRSVCTVTTTSAWSPPINFTTPCNAVTPNFNFDFANGIDACWSNADEGTPATTPAGTDSNWSDGGFLNNGDDGAMKVNIYTSFFLPSTFNSWLITPVFDLSAGGYQVKFDYGLTQYGETDADSLGSDDLVQFVVSQDGGTTWTVLQTWDAANSPSNTSATYTLDLTGYTGANTKFAFYATNGSVADTNDVEFFIDNLVVESMSLSTTEASHAKNTIKAYPNPFSDVLNVSDVKNVKSVSVIDFAGRVVKTIDNPSSSLHLGELKSGLYMVILNMNDGSRQTIKAIKK